MTSGMDLCRVLWLKSPNAEVWLDRRTTYTRSLAVMSMVGYILGIGDRHPCNLMLERNTGKIIHIDFGDCFEVAMQRDKYPEKVPFRLTRMLVNAMEVSGIEGTFRSTCEIVMEVLRKNNSSVMAVLEAFIYDPLINWRLLTGGHGPGRVPGRGMNDSPLREDKDNKRGTTSGLEKENKNEEKFDGEEEVGSLPGSKSGPRVGGGIPEVDQEPLVNIGMTGGMEAVRERDREREEGLNAKALEAIRRVEDKLKGTDFGPSGLDIPAQVERLILEATSNINLCQSYIGWCPFW